MAEPASAHPSPRAVRAQRRTLAPGARQTAQPIAPLRSFLSSRCARSAARSRRARGRQLSRLPLSVLSSPLGARVAPHARAGRAADSSAACSLSLFSRCARSAARSRRARGRQLSRMLTLALLSVRAQRRTLAPGARQTAQPHAHSRSSLGARAAPHARAGRAADSSADCPELKRAKSLGRTDRDQPMRWRTYESRPNGRMLSPGFSAIGPAPPSDPGQTRVSHRAPQAPRVPHSLSRAAARRRLSC